MQCARQIQEALSRRTLVDSTQNLVKAHLKLIVTVVHAIGI